jgi:hypothetical protein
VRKVYSAAALVVAGATVFAVTTANASDFSYMETVAPGTNLKVLATSGDQIKGYTLFGVPDGMGFLKDGSNYTLLMNHELLLTDPVTGVAKRANGAATGSTVSALNFDSATQSISGGTELLKNISWWDYKTNAYSTKPGAPEGAAAKDSYGTTNHGTGLSRFCSSSTSQPGELSYKDASGITYGYTGPAYWTGEESSDESRRFVSDLAGNLVQLPRLGLASTETEIVVPTRNKVTAVLSNEDGSATSSQLMMYVGEKTTTGSWVDKAGLTNGNLFVAQMPGYESDNKIRTGLGKRAMTPVIFNKINWNQNGVALNAEAQVNGSVFSRIEDGEFDPNNPSDYYFLTTESNKDPKATAVNPDEPTFSRDGGALWKLHFNDIKNPLAGGMLTMLLDGSEAPYLSKPDNLTFAGNGNILIQEDPGGNDHVARVVAYRMSDGKLATVAKFKDVYFKPGGAQFITNDEESSGIIDVTKELAKAGDKKSYFILNAQVHATATKARIDLPSSMSDAQKQALVDAGEGGQLYMLTIDDWSKIYG